MIPDNYGQRNEYKEAAWTVLVVFISTYFQLILRILPGHEPVRVQVRFPKAAVKRFDADVVSRHVRA